MSDLQDLIDIPLDEATDEELEHIIMTGRAAREAVVETRAKKKPSLPKVNYDEFE